MNDSEGSIRVEEIERVYQQGEVQVHALRGLDLEVKEGEFTSLAGPSGSGKTTLLNMIGCLDEPSSGRVYIGGEDVTGLSGGRAATFRLGNIGFVFQAYNLIPVLTAYENAEFVLMMQGIPPPERREKVMPLLEKVGLKDMMDRKPPELSGGQQQRVAVVRALASKPKIILADEPTANLDSETSTDLLDLMVRLNDEYDSTFLFSSHDSLVIDRARRVIHLRSGRIDEIEDRTGSS